MSYNKKMIPTDMIIGELDTNIRQHSGTDMHRHYGAGIHHRTGLADLKQ